MPGAAGTQHDDLQLQLSASQHDAQTVQPSWQGDRAPQAETEDGAMSDDQPESSQVCAVRFSC